MNASVPNIPFVNFYTIALAYPAELTLKRLGSVMLLLVDDVLRKRIDMVRADRERPITFLLIEISQVRHPLFDPFRRFPFQLSDERGNIDLLAETAK
jgi:hypothetical protein